MLRLKNKHYFKVIFSAVILSLATYALFSLTTGRAYAVNMVDCPDGTSVPLPSGQTVDEVCAGHMQKAATTQQGVNLGNASTQHQCGSGDGRVATSINFGCKGESCLTNHPDAAYCTGNNSGILDVVFAIIRFLSYGVGLVIVGSLVVAGIQYTSSQGDPKASAMAQERIKSTVIALLVFIFAYAILDYIVPAGFLK